MEDEILDIPLQELDSPPEEINKEPAAPEEPAEPEKAEESKKFQTMDAQKRYWRERAQKAEAKVRDSKPAVSKPSEEDSDFWKAKVDFLLSNPDKKYLEEEIDHIANVASRKGVSLSEAAKSEDGYINYQRAKVAETNKIPAPGSSSPFSSLEKSPEDIAKMSAAEHRKYEEQIMKARQGQGI